MDQLPFMNNVSIERLEEIEVERQQTLGDSNFQSWMKELNISHSYVDSTSLLRGKEIVGQYDYSNYRYKVA
jgi:hypothetical protein